MVNNVVLVCVGNIELIIIVMEYYGMINVEGVVIVVVIQVNGLGVKMLLIVYLLSVLVLKVSVDVIFIIFISLDSSSVNMYGYMVEMFIVMVDGVSYIFYCFKLVVEIDGEDCIVSINNEIWV